MTTTEKHACVDYLQQTGNAQESWYVCTFCGHGFDEHDVPIMRADAERLENAARAMHDLLKRIDQHWQGTGAHRVNGPDDLHAVLMWTQTRIDLWRDIRAVLAEVRGEA